MFTSIAAIAMLTTGCSAPTTTQPTAPTVEPVATVVPTESASAPTASASPTATPSVTAPKSARGNVIKTVGQPGWLSLPSGEKTMSFVVKNITVDSACTSPYPQTPQNGHFISVAIDVETTPRLAEGINKFVWFGAQSWKLIADNGTTYNGSLDSGPAYGCLNDSERIPSKIGPAEKVSGTLVLDVPVTSGTLIFESTGGGGGWEWAFPAK
jgi:hypothetical protein